MPNPSQWVDVAAPVAPPPAAPSQAQPSQWQDIPNTPDTLGTGLTDALSNPQGWIPAAASVAARVAGRIVPGAPMMAGFGYNDRASFETAETQGETTAFVKDLHAKGKEAVDAFHAGDYTGAARHTADALAQYFGFSEPVKEIEKRIDSGDSRGAAGYGLGLLTQAAATAGVNKVMGWGGAKIDDARALDRSTMLQNAVVVHKNDADFLKKIPEMLPDVQRGAKLTGTPITDLESTTRATEAAQHELMSALEDHKEVGRRKNLELNQTDVNAAMKKAIPPGLAKGERSAIEAAIDEDHPPGGVLKTDQVFNKAQLNNSRRKQFYAGGEGTQNAKLMTNAGDMSVLRAEGDYYRQWIDKNLGSLAAEQNSKWGDLNGLKHYLQAEEVRRGRNQPVNGVEEFFKSTGVDPHNPKASLLGSMMDRAIGRPVGIDNLLKATFEGVPASGNLPRPHIPYQLEAPPANPAEYNPMMGVEPDRSSVRGVNAQFGEQKSLPAPAIQLPGNIDPQVLLKSRLVGRDSGAEYVPQETAPNAREFTAPGAPAFRVGFPANAPKQLPSQRVPGKPTPTQPPVVRFAPAPGQPLPAENIRAATVPETQIHEANQRPLKMSDVMKGEVPRDTARGASMREHYSQVIAGKPYSKLSTMDRLLVDKFITEEGGHPIKGMSK